MVDRAPRVVHVIDHMGSGGAQRVVLDLIEARRSGDGDSVVSLRDHCRPELWERMRRSGIAYRSLDIARGRPLRVHRLRAAIRDSAADVVHTHLEFSNLLGAVAAQSLGPTRPRSIVHIHNDLDRHYTRLHRLAGRLLAALPDAHVAPSRTIADAARAVFGHRSKRVVVVPYGIDAHWFAHTATPASDALRAGAPVVIGTAARLAPQKSLHDLIRAVPPLLASQPALRLLVFGDGPLRGALEALARSLQVAHAVRFLGFVPDVASAYAAPDAFVLPSRNEGMPICLLEAMAMGIPVVGSDVPGIADLVRHEQTGLLVPHGDPPAIARAVLRILSDDVLRNRTRSEARKQVESRFTRGAVAEQMEPLYAELVSQPAIRASGVDPTG